MSDRNTGTIILGIIAIAGLGLSGFMFIRDTLSSPSKDTGLVLVGLWDDLDRNMGYGGHTEVYDWLIEFRDSLVNNPKYVTVTNDNTRFVLASGLYKISLSILFDSLVEGEYYGTILLRNGVTDTIIIDHYHNVSSSIRNQHFFYSSIFVEGNGVDYFELNCVSVVIADSFIPISNDAYNQLSIEYVK